MPPRSDQHATFDPISIRNLLARVAISTLAVKVGSVGLAFALNILLARLLGSQNYGDYVLALSWVSIMVIVGALGMEGTALRFVAGYVGKEAWGLLRGFARRGAQWVMAASFLIAILFGVGVFLYKGVLRPNLVNVFIVGLALIPISAMLAFVAACLQGLNSRFVTLAQSVQLFRVFVFGLFIIVLLAINYRQLDSVVIMGLNLMAAILVLTVFTVIFYRKLPRQIKGVHYVYENRRWLVVALPFLALSGFQFIITQIDALMIGIFMGSENAGFYTAASRIAVLITFGIASVNAVVAPMIAQYYSQQKFHELQRIVSIAAKGIFLFALTAAIILFAFGKLILGLFGSGFNVAYLSLVILLIGQLIDSLAGSVGYLMTMTGHQREVMYVMGGCAVLNILLNMVMIPAFGLQGAAIVTTTTIALWNIILVKRVRVNLGINSAAFKFSGS